mmetsp:Transcript_29767/g.54236  ORF Transcript_29767/g.54236 Transcript_29767/m.54236 type:complete len:238 (-) Transcript_29767:2161-2874(-)
MCIGKLLGCVIKSSTKTWADSQQATAEGGNQIFPSAGANNSVVSTTHSRTMVCGNHEHHLNELCTVRRELPSEPQQANNPADTHVLGKHLRDGHTAVLELLASVVRYGRDEVRWLADHTKFLSPSVIHRNLGGFSFHKLNDVALFDHLCVLCLDGLWQLVERIWDDDTCFLHGSILGCRSLHISTCLGTCVAELNGGLEVRCHRANTPTDHWLGNPSTLDGLDEVVLINATNLSQEQ